MRSLVARAQAPTDFSGLGYPELAITITENGYEGVPATTAAGRYRVVVTNSLTNAGENSSAIGFLSPTPVGMSAADAIQAFGLGGQTGPASPEAGASPDSGGDQGGDEGGQLPLVVYQMYFAGGVVTQPGQTSDAIVDLLPNEYVVWGDDPTATQPPATMTVTGDFPQDVVDPDTDITFTLLDFQIQVEGNLTAGMHTIRVQHHGAEPHFLEIDKGPDTMTRDQVLAAITSEMTGTPAAGGFSEADMQNIYYSPTQSIGTVTFQHLELTEGTFLAACFFPTAGTGVPHVANGMVEVFSTTGSGAPEGTPTS